MRNSGSIRHPWCLCVLLLSSAAHPLRAQAPATSEAIDVSITGVRTRLGGELIVSLYHGSDGWLQADSARLVRKLPLGADSIVTITFDGLPPTRATPSR